MSDLNSVKLENAHLSNEMSSTQCSPQHIANNLEVKDVIDLTEDDCCFVCDKMLSSCSRYTLATALTNISKTNIIQKLGEVLGNGFIILISDEDCICQNCLNLFNKLDNIEIQLQTARANIVERIQRTHGNQLNQNQIPSHVYKALQMIVENDVKQPPKKKSSLKTVDVLKVTQSSSNSNSLQHQKKSLSSTKKDIKSLTKDHKQSSLIPDMKFQSVDSMKENVIQSQNNELKNYSSSNINNSNASTYSLSYIRDILDPTEAMMVEYKYNSNLPEC